MSFNHETANYALTPAGDRYFDGLTDKFSRSLYQAPRGELRLVMLDYLLPQLLSLSDQHVLDVGGGLGQQTAWFAKHGHRVTMAEPSEDMLSYAQQWHRDEAPLPHASITYLQAPLQALPQQAPGPWSLIACHAVLEWLGNPQAALATLSDLLAPGGQLSLMVFNRDALRFSNAIKGNLEKALSDRLERSQRTENRGRGWHPSVPRLLTPSPRNAFRKRNAIGARETVLSPRPALAIGALPTLHLNETGEP
jgi:S-adenosylmethionine-dependent methyltransferase